MPKDSDKPKSEQQEPEPERKFSQEQYDMLKRCSDKKDIRNWNAWREEHPDKEVQLQFAPLGKFWLEGADLQGAKLEGAKLQGARLWGADLQGAWLVGAKLQGARLWGADLQGADFEQAIVDGSTLIWECEVDRKTNFKGVGLDSARIDPETKQLLQYNVRRMGWEEWCPKQKRWVGWVTRKFWEMSDFGISTQKVIKTFFKLAIVFAVIYYVLGAIDYYLIGVKDYPGPVADLFVDEGGPIHCLHVPLRSVYFSVVTMTTLGFGDMHANPHNFWWGWFGYLLLMVQVILGYVLLGALVTRFAVLFTAGGPAGKFAKEYKKPEDD